MHKLIKKTWKKHKHRIYNIALFCVAGIIVLTGLFVLWAVNLTMPDFDSFEERRVAESTKIYDRTGEVLLWSFQNNIRRSVVSSSDISRNIKNATVAIEDKIFYEHRGFRLSSFIRATFANIRSGSTSQGGSTITQQVIKNTLLTGEKKYSRKLKEIVLALKLERIMSKDEILTIYLNEIPYGGQIYGIEEATQAYFGKSARNVSLAEAAHLAALPNAPSYYSPYGKNRKALEERKNHILDRMFDLGFATKEEVTTAKAEVVSFLPRDTFAIKAPHFVFYVQDYLKKKYGEDVIESGGLKVISTLDWNLQRKAEEVISDASKSNEENYNAHNAGAVGTDPKTGQILVMVGSRNYFETENDGNFNIATALRQPGSTFKPFVYATAFKKGYTPETVVFDVPTQFSTLCSPNGVPLTANIDPENCYTPTNFDEIFRGPIKFRDALGKSINIPAIKVLYLAGIKESVQTARDFGINTLSSDGRYGLTLVLGGGEVRLIELVNAYGVFANDGVYNPTTPILRVENRNGQVLEEYKPIPQKVISENITRTISDILSDNVARNYLPSHPLNFGEKDVAAKTGTTNDSRDMWVIGYIPNLAFGLWVGNNDNTPMEKKVAGLVVAPMWSRFMNEAIKIFPEEQFGRLMNSDTKESKPVLRGIWQGGEIYEVDSITGLLATKYTPDETRKESVVADVHTILHWVNRTDPTGPTPTNPQLDPQYYLWEYGVREWAKMNGYGEVTSSKPVTFDNVHLPEFSPLFSISVPLSSQIYDATKPMPVVLNVKPSKFPLSEAEFYLNNVYLGQSSVPNLNFNFIPGDRAIQGDNELRVILKDKYKNQSIQTVIVEFSI